MIGSTWNGLFLAVAVGAGMLAQQAVLTLPAGSEEKQLGSAADLRVFCSAEDYYLAGRFSASAAGADSAAPNSATLAAAQDESVLAASSDRPSDEQIVRAPTTPESITGASRLASGESGSRPETADAAEMQAIAETTSAADLSSGELRAELASVASPPAEDVEPGRSPELAPTESPIAESPVAESPAPELVADRRAAGGLSSESVIPEPPVPALDAIDSVETLPLPAPAGQTTAADGDGQADDAQSESGGPRAPVRAPAPTNISGLSSAMHYAPGTSWTGRSTDSADLVRERAVARGEQLRQRIETRKWLGITPLRPAVDGNPNTTGAEPRQIIVVVPKPASRPQH